MEENEHSAKRERRVEIDGTVYIVESETSPRAMESAYTKIKRLILNNAKAYEKELENSRNAEKSESAPLPSA